MADNIIYYIIYGLFKALALLPFCVLYVLSDFVYFLLYHVVRYRRKVVEDNLAKCFPDKTQEERKLIERGFYRHFADCFVETIKLLHISDREVKRRITFENVELIDRLTKAGKSIVVYFSHCGNWEWAPSVTLHTTTGGVEYCQVYRPLRNRAFDRLMLKVRSRFGSHSFAKATVFRDLLHLKKDGIVSVTGFMSDQKPSHGDPTYVTMFLNRPTAFITGTETLATRMGMAAVYWDMEKISRGHYRIVTRLLDDGSHQAPRGELTQNYALLLETNIRRNPSIWLWTHKRWKNKVTLEQK